MTNKSKQTDSAQVNYDMMTKERKYALLIEAHSQDLYKYALWLCKDKNMAEDVMQEAFLRNCNYFRYQFERSNDSFVSSAKKNASNVGA